MNKIAPRALYQLSRDGLTTLKEKVLALEQERKDLAKRLRSIRADQSITDTAEKLVWLEKVTSFQLLEREITKIRTILTKATPLAATHTNRVQLGSRVAIAAKGSVFHYTIVSSLEANPDQGKISDLSPLGKALLGKTLRDLITFLPNPKATKPQRLQLVDIA